MYVDIIIYNRVRRQYYSHTHTYLDEWKTIFSSDCVSNVHTNVFFFFCVVNLVLIALFIFGVNTVISLWYFLMNEFLARVVSVRSVRLAVSLFGLYSSHMLSDEWMNKWESEWATSMANMAWRNVCMSICVFVLVSNEQYHFYWWWWWWWSIWESSDPLYSL